MNRALRNAAGALAAALLVSGSALAEDAADPDFIGPPPPPVVVPAPPKLVEPAPAAQPAPPPAAAASARPDWLRQSPRPAAEKLETKASMSPVRVGLMLILVGLLGGAAFYARRRRQGGRTLPLPQEKLKVLGSTRVGPKAFAVVAEVGGKRLLLGVTEQAVNTLAWLEDGADEEEREERVSRPAPARREADEALQGPSGFLRVLRSAVGSGDARKVAVDEIARTTRDEVTLSRRSRSESNDELEGQVQGLARRRRRDPS